MYFIKQFHFKLFNNLLELNGYLVGFYYANVCSASLHNRGSVDTYVKLSTTEHLLTSGSFLMVKTFIAVILAISSPRK